MACSQKTLMMQMNLKNGRVTTSQRNIRVCKTLRAFDAHRVTISLLSSAVLFGFGFYFEDVRRRFAGRYLQLLICERGVQAKPAGHDTPYIRFNSACN